MEFSTINLENAVNVFYRTEAGQQAEAHQWLTEAQNSQQAWSFVWELLQPQKSSEVQFFAATTLHTKILKYWNEVPQDHYDLLKKKILDSIVNFAMGPKIILNRLCITLSAFIIHTVPHHWPNAFEDLVSSFQPHNLPNIEPERVIWILLEILTVIPEEFAATPEPKSAVSAVLKRVAKDIMKVIEMCLMPGPDNNFNMANLTTYLNSARCAVTWIQLGEFTIAESSNLLNYLMDLICFVYWNKQDSDGFLAEEQEFVEIASEAIVNLMTHPLTNNYRRSVLPPFAAMMVKFDKVLKAELKSVEGQNKDIVNTMFSVLTQITEMHIKLMIGLLLGEDENEVFLTQNLLQAMLDCASLPGQYPIDECTSSMCFSFWYTLQDEILMLDPEECNFLLESIKPYYTDLVPVLIGKSRYPNNYDGPKWSLDDKEAFRCYRQDIADTMMYCYNVLNNEMLQILQRELSAAIQVCCDSSGRVITENWGYIEGCFHAYFAVAENIESEELYLPKFMCTLQEIPYDHLNSKVLSSVLDTIGAYSEWLADHPNMLEKVFPLVTSGIRNQEVSPSATMALKELTNNCQKYMEPFAPHILASCQESLQSGQFKLAECLRIMHSIGKVLSILPVPSVMEYLNVLLTPYFEHIEKLLQMEPNVSAATSLITRLKLLSAMFGSLHVNITDPSVQQPVFVVLEKTLPVYKAIVNKYRNNLDVMNVLCSVLKHAISTLLDDCKPLVNDLFDIILITYRDTPQASIIMVAQTLLILLGKDADFREAITLLLNEIINVTCQMSAKSLEKNQLSERSDVLEAFFSLMAAICKKHPHLLLIQGMDVNAVFQLAMICLALPEKDTVKYSTSFLVNFITQSKENPLEQVIFSCGEQLVVRIFLNLGGAAPRSAIEPMTELLLTLNKKHCDILSRWLNTVLMQQEDFPSSKVNKQNKEHIIRIILREKASKRKLLEHVTEFSLMCRGIIKHGNAP